EAVRQLAATLNRGLVRPLVAWNFGPNEPLPRFVFDVEPPEDEKVREDTREVRGRVFKQAKELGVPVSVEQVQAELGIRPPRAGETLLVAMADRPVLVATNVAPVRTHALSDAPDLDQLEEVIRRFEESGKGVWADFIADVQTRLGQAKTLEEVDALLLRAVRELEPGLLQQVLLEATLTGELMGRLHAGNNDLPVADLPKVPPAEAIDWWAKKEVVSPSEYAAMEEDHRGRAFTIAQFTSASALLEAKGHLDRVIAEGGTLSDFEDGLEEIYKRTGMEPLDPWRLYTVFHTNTASAYNAGRWTQQQRPETLARRPFLQLLTMEDSHVRVSHSAMHGFVAAADSPIWDVWYPPNGFGCRC
ncbi:MAG TPA: DUF935 family protein, partial [Myxococcota bacterium]|nr:DUF935 family protein [Myxococcota bacterium]